MPRFALKAASEPKRRVSNPPLHLFFQGGPYQPAVVLPGEIGVVDLFGRDLA
jgi:hypothetical protein